MGVEFSLLEYRFRVRDALVGVVLCALLFTAARGDPRAACLLPVVCTLLIAAIEGSKRRAEWVARGLELTRGRSLWLSLKALGWALAIMGLSHLAALWAFLDHSVVLFGWRSSNRCFDNFDFRVKASIFSVFFGGITALALRRAFEPQSADSGRFRRLRRYGPIAGMLLYLSLEVGVFLLILVMGEP